MLRPYPRSGRLDRRKNIPLSFKSSSPNCGECIWDGSGALGHRTIGHVANGHETLHMVQLNTVHLDTVILDTIAFGH
ncbi:ubiquitin carboxyl-terminal hydrolase 13, partial [Lasius niger]